MRLNASDREIMFLWSTTEINCAPGVQKSFSVCLSLSLYLSPAVICLRLVAT
jgi:hypothetical protein